MATRGVAPPKAGTPRAVVHVSRTVPGSRDQVFRAWTDPERVSQWFGGPLGMATSAEADVRPGGSYRIHIDFPGRVAPPVFAVGTYLEVEPPQRLVYTLRWESEATLARVLGRALDLPATEAETDSRVTVEFREHDGSTEVRLTHELLDTRRNRAFHRVGWKSSLSNFAAMLSRAG
jgi:uncharacterized protein YndB with AHSA1/START domain